MSRIKPLITSVPFQVTPWCNMDLIPGYDSGYYDNLYREMFPEVYEQTYGPESHDDGMIKGGNISLRRRCGICHGMIPGPTSGGWPKGLNHVPVDEQLEVGRRIYEQGIRHLNVTGGDPLVLPHDHLVTLFKELFDIGFHMTLYSNMLGLTPEMLAEISPYVASFQVPLEGPDPETHAAVRGPIQGFDGKTLVERMGESNVYKQFFDALTIIPEMLRLGNKVYVSTVLSRQNYHEMPELAQMLSDLRVHEWRIFKFFTANMAARDVVVERHDVSWELYDQTVEALKKLKFKHGVFIDPSLHKEGEYYMTINADLTGTVRRITHGLRERNIIGAILEGDHVQELYDKCFRTKEEVGLSVSE